MVEELLDMLKRQDNNSLLQHPETTISDLESLLTIDTNIINPWVKCWYRDSTINVKGIFRLSVYLTLVVQGFEWRIDEYYEDKGIVIYAGMLQYKVLHLGTDSDSEEPTELNTNSSDECDSSNEDDVFILEIPDTYNEELEYVISFKLKTMGSMKFEDWTDNIILSILQYGMEFPLELYLNADLKNPDDWLTNYIKIN
jgi:hypothetical protein